MKRLTILAPILCLLCSCATGRKAAVPLPANDSTMVRVRYKLIESIDTVFVTLPQQTVERMTRDTTSTLESDYAKSTAKILPDGLLYHDLETKPQPVPVSVKSTREERDSSMIREVETPVPYPVEVEVNRLTWLQQAQIYGCRIMVALLALGLIIRYRKDLLAFIIRLCRLIR